MFYIDRAKSRTFLVRGRILIVIFVGLYLLRTLQINIENPSRSVLIPATAFLTEVSSEPVLGVFEGITPCSDANPPLPQIPQNTNCEQMIWKLTLYQDPATGNPTTYQLTSSYGLSQQGTTGLQAGGTQLNLEGKWAKIQGAKANPNAVVYQLNPDDPQAAINFIKMDDNILHLLTQDKSLMVGNGAWSYTLNRTDKRIVSKSPTTDLTTRATPSSPVMSATSSTGVFDGRIPCVEMVLALHNLSTSGCQRIKLRLTLDRSTETQPQATFELLSVYVGKGDTRYMASGTWSILQGTGTNPEALVYQLSPTGSEQPLLLLKADDNHLFFLDSELNLMVGDALGSFTLSRAS